MMAYETSLTSKI